MAHLHSCCVVVVPLLLLPLLLLTLSMMMSQEHGADVIVTAPTVPYRLVSSHHNHEICSENDGFCIENDFLMKLQVPSEQALAGGEHKEQIISNGMLHDTLVQKAFCVSMTSVIDDVVTLQLPSSRMSNILAVGILRSL